MDYDYYYMKQTVDDMKKAKREQYRQNSKKRLIDKVKKKFQTTMIGALDKFERRFGHLWGIGKDVKDLTQDEIKFFEQWQMVRTDILNLGNAQQRACLDEIAQYTISWDKIRTKFVVSKVK